MRDLLDNYVVVSADCTGYFIYTEFYPTAHPSFISYNTPLIGTVVWDHKEYLKLCEHYDYYTGLPLQLVPPLRSDTGPFDTIQDDVRVMLVHEKINNYPHLQNDAQIFDSPITKKWASRTKLGKGKTKIFLSWEADWAYMAGPTSVEERKLALERFIKLDGYSFFITSDKEEEFEDDRHQIKFASDFVQMYKTRPKSGNMHLETMLGWVSMFKELIERKVV